jgi:hypothetical protein
VEAYSVVGYGGSQIKKESKKNKELLGFRMKWTTALVYL